MKFVLTLLVALVSLCCGSEPAFARNAGLLLSPTRIVLENGTKYATVYVKNDGDSVGRYVIEMVDTEMSENGAIKLREPGVKDEFSALDLLSFSPHSMTLKPDEYQTVRILVKNNDLPNGEYRSHLQVKMTESDLDLGTNKPVVDATSIVPKARIATVIPVILRKGDTSYTLTLDDAKLAMGGGSDKPAPEVLINMSFSGNRSLLCDVKVTHISPSGKETQLSFFRGVVIYRGVAKRSQPISLDVPQGVNIHEGRLHIAILSQENEGSNVLATKEITP